MSLGQSCNNFSFVPLPVLYHTRFLSRRRRWHPTPVLMHGKSHGQRSLVGCSPWGREESDTTEQLHFHSSLSCIGEGNGNPLQSSCLENPRGGRAWWAAVSGVIQSRTRLKWLSSSSTGSQKVAHNRATEHACTHMHRARRGTEENLQMLCCHFVGKSREAHMKCRASLSETK